MCIYFAGVSKLRQTIDDKFTEKEIVLATKDDISMLELKIAEVKAEMIKW